jgi:UDP:flavonoid glycosyltransferase YjiC (YdhE family)
MECGVKIFMATYGSRGDVQPLVALARGLAARGHEATLAGPPEWQSWARSLGCPYTPLGNDLRPFLARGEASHRPGAAIAFHNLVIDEVANQFEELPQMVAGADLAVGASLCLALSSVAEALKVPFRYLAFTPQMLPSDAHPCPIFQHQRRPAWINRLGWRLNTLVQNLDLRPRLNRHRRRLGLSPLRDIWPHLLGRPLLLACDSELAPVPGDLGLPVVQTGYPHLETEAALPADLEAFITAGTRPLFAGFGSMPPPDTRCWVPLVVDAVRANGRRLVLQADPAAIASCKALCPGTDLFIRPSFPHAALFPRLKAVIHHGGAGTTAMAARSGVPQILVPHILDQFYWAERIRRRGLGPAPIWRTRLTFDKLKKAIIFCIRDSAMRRRAEKVGERIRRRDPLLSAARFLEGTKARDAARKG